MPFTEAAFLIQSCPYETALPTYPIDYAGEYRILYLDGNFNVSVTKYTSKMPIYKSSSSDFYEDTCNHTCSAQFIREIVNTVVETKTHAKKLSLTGLVSIADNAMDFMPISLHRDILCTFKHALDFQMLIYNRSS